MTKVHAAIEIASAGPQHPGGFVHQMLRDGRDYAAWAVHRSRQGFDLAIGPEHVPLVYKALKGGG